MIRHVDHQGVALQAQPPEPVENHAHIAIQIMHRSVVGGDDALLLLWAQVAKNQRNLAGVFRSHGRHREGCRVEQGTVLDRKIEGRMRLLKAHPEREGIRFMFIQEMAGLLRHPGAAHLFIAARERQFLGVQPDARGILHWAPRRLGANRCEIRRRSHGIRPSLLNHIFGPGGRKAMQSRPPRSVEVHLAKHGRFVSVRCQRLRQSRTVVRQRCLEHRHTHGVRQLAGQDRLPRRRAHRRIAVVPRKMGSFGNQTVQVGGLRQTIALRAKDISGMVVRNHEEQVRLPVARASRPRSCRDARHPHQFSSRNHCYPS